MFTFTNSDNWLNERLYIHMIYQTTSQYAAFLPSSQIRLGDYGEVDQKTGEFLIKGNLYKEFPEMSQKVQEAVETPEASRSITASRQKESAGEVGIAAEIPPVVDATLSGRWHFAKDRHAALVLIDPVLVEIPYEGQLGDFFAEDEARFKKFSRYAICTRFYKCTSYAMLMTNGNAGSASFKFDVSAAVASNVVAGGKVAGGWSVSAESGVWTTGLYEPNVHRYIPLRTLRKVEKRGKIMPIVPKHGRIRIFQPGPVAMPTFELPWSNLDETGIEIVEKPEEDKSDESGQKENPGDPADSGAVEVADLPKSSD